MKSRKKILFLAVTICLLFSLNITAFAARPVTKCQ